MPLYGGIDLHANNSVIVLLNEQDEEVYRKRLPNALSTILEQLAPYHTEMKGLVVESTYNWDWLVDGLMEADYRVHLANRAAMQQYGRHRRQTAAAGPDTSGAAADGGGPALDRAGCKSPSGALLHRRRLLRTHSGTPSTEGGHRLYVPQMPGKRKWEVRGARCAAYAPLAAA
jgi:hypothetical protein